VELAVEETVKKFGRVDVCFNAAGMGGEPGAIVDQRTENLDAVLGLNLRGVWLCERAQIKQMLKQEMRDVT
jgi:NAD(P)-dependent dehydrogenase (short-subunit alcohol dehydrogenase family)